MEFVLAEDVAACVTLESLESHPSMSSSCVNVQCWNLVSTR